MAALEIESPEEQDAYLDEACGKDTSLRRRVEGLLECHARSGSLLEHPADGTQTFGFEAAVAADALRLKLRGYGRAPRLAEIEVLGRPSR
jgi:hypothetical protein